MAETVIALICFGIPTLILVGIGVWMLKSKAPVGFYSGEKPPKPEEIRDVAAYNKRHGWMWICYGLGMPLAWLVGVLTGKEAVLLILVFAEVIGGAFVLVFLHHRWLKKYKVEPSEKV